MTAEYMPTDDEIREQVAWQFDGQLEKNAYMAFDRWLAARDVRVKAEAWDEGARWAFEEITGEPESRFGLAPGDNPHRKESTE